MALQKKVLWCLASALMLLPGKAVWAQPHALAGHVVFAKDFVGDGNGTADDPTLTPAVFGVAQPCRLRL